MTVADEAVRTLHDLLGRRFDDHRRRLGRLTEDEVRHFSVMVDAAFFEAARKRFLKSGRAAGDADVIGYVARARSWDEGAAEEIHPPVGEMMIRCAIGKPGAAGFAGDFDGGVVYRTELMLLAALIRDAEYSADELSEFMGRARDIAGAMLS